MASHPPRRAHRLAPWFLVAALSVATAHAAEPDAPTTSEVDPDASDFAGRLDAELGVRGGLTADQVAARAARTSFDVGARRAEILEAAAHVDRARAAYLPKLSVSARYTRVSDMGSDGAGSIVVAPGAAQGPLSPGTTLVNAPLSFPVIQDQYTFQAGLSVPLSDYFLRISRQHSASLAGERAATLSAVAARQRVTASARLAYYGWVRARLEAVVAEQSVIESERHESDVKSAEGVGAATRADVLSASARLAASRLLLDRSRSLARIAEEQVRTVLHESGRRELRIGEDVRGRMAPLPGDSGLEALVAQAHVERPELRAMEARVTALREQVKIERAANLPRLDGFANAQYANPNARAFPQRDEFRGSWDVGAVLTWTPTDVPGALASTRGAEAAVARAVADQADLRDTIRVDVATALENVHQADAAVTPSEDRLAAAGEAYRTRRVLFQNGRATSVELVDAEGELTRARLEALGARIDQRVARARLAHAVGTLR